MADELLYDAGDFGPWLKSKLDPSTLANAVVACGDCSACCSTFDAIPIGRDEPATLAAIPVEFLQRVENQATGTTLLLTSETHVCPMLRDGACSIYDVRPRACRIFDCRTMAAADLVDKEGRHAAMGERVDKWVFSYETDDDRARQLAVLDAVEFIYRHPTAFRSRGFSYEPSWTATQAIRIHELFLPEREKNQETEIALISEAIAIMRRWADIEHRVD